MTEHTVGTREEWLAARMALLAEEKELTRHSDELARKRQALSWVAVEKDYTFETDEGTKTLAEVFEGRSQLLVYHFMFGPTVEGWPDAGCPGCSYTADSLDGAVAHLPPRGATFVAVSRAPLENLFAYRRRMGWSFPWVSAAIRRGGRAFATNTNQREARHESSIGRLRGGMAGGVGGAPRPGEGRHQGPRRARRRAPTAAASADREGLRLRRSGRRGHLARPVRWSQAAAALPL